MMIVSPMGAMWELVYWSLTRRTNQTEVELQMGAQKVDILSATNDL